MTTLFQHRRRAKRKKKRVKIVDVDIMHTIYKDEKLALLYHRGVHTPDPLYRVLGTRQIQMLHEVWTYNPITKRFNAYKNRGLGSELVKYMAKAGITVKCSAARITDAASLELKFAEDKDYFLFKLKYAL